MPILPILSNYFSSKKSTMYAHSRQTATGKQKFCENLSWHFFLKNILFAVTRVQIRIALIYSLFITVGTWWNARFRQPAEGILILITLFKPFLFWNCHGAHNIPHIRVYRFASIHHRSAATDSFVRKAPAEIF